MFKYFFSQKRLKQSFFYKVLLLILYFNFVILTTINIVCKVIRKKKGKDFTSNGLLN